MPDATLVASYPAYRIAYAGRIRLHAASASGVVQVPDATLVASYPAYRIAHAGRIRRSRRIRQWRGTSAGCDACRVLSGLQDCTCRADKASRRIRQWRGTSAGCDACRVLSGLQDCTCRADKASRRIRQWRGTSAGCDACRVLSGLQDCTCRADKAFTPHPPVAWYKCRMRRLSHLIRPTGLHM